MNIYILIFRVNEIDEMTLFPFYAEIWGTVSDWIMILVTAFTGYFLVRTFVLQKEALNMEKYKFSISIRPSFSAEFKFSKPLSHINEGNKIQVNLQIKVLNHRALMERIEVIKSRIITCENLDVPFNGSHLMEVGALRDVFFIFPKEETIGQNSFPINPSIFIYFRDINLKKFKQLIHLQTKPEFKITVHPPEEFLEDDKSYKEMLG